MLEIQPFSEKSDLDQNTMMLNSIFSSFSQLWDASFEINILKESLDSATHTIKKLNRENIKYRPNLSKFRILSMAKETSTKPTTYTLNIAFEVNWKLLNRYIIKNDLGILVDVKNEKEWKLHPKSNIDAAWVVSELDILENNLQEE